MSSFGGGRWSGGGDGRAASTGGIGCVETGSPTGAASRTGIVCALREVWGNSITGCAAIVRGGTISVLAITRLIGFTTITARSGLEGCTELTGSSGRHAEDRA